MHFLIGALPEVQNLFWNHFSHKVIYNYYSKFYLGAFQPIFNKVKKRISHCISNLARKGLRGFFPARKLIFFCRMSCIYLLNSHGGPQSFDFDITYLYPIIVTPCIKPLETLKTLPLPVLLSHYMSSACKPFKNRPLGIYILPRTVKRQSYLFFFNTDIIKKWVKLLNFFSSFLLFAQ